MKWILLVIFLFGINNSISAQVSNYITFDPGDTNARTFLTIDTTHYKQNKWQIGEPHKRFFTSAFSPPNVIVTDTLNPCVANDTSVFIVRMPWYVPYFATSEIAGTYLSFEYQLEKDSGSIAMFEVSIDSGLHWYNTKDILPIGFNWAYLSQKPNLSDTITGWTPFEIDVTPPHSYTYSDTSGTFLFRFTFITDSSTSGNDGWMIDDILMFYYIEGVQNLAHNNTIGLFPNPAITSLTITSTDKIAIISITNLLGQTLYTHEYNTEKAQIDVSTFASGIYFIKINGTEVKKFVKE